MFFNLTNDMVHSRKNILRIFYQISNRLQDSFDTIIESAEEMASSSKPKTKPFQTLFDKLDFTKDNIALCTLKFINQMLQNVPDKRDKQGKFLAMMG